MFGQIESILWILGGVFTTLYFDVINSMRFDYRIDNFYFNLGVGFASIFIFIGFYFIIYCSYMKGISAENWETQNKFLIPLATISFLVSGISWNLCLLGIYGWKTPFIIFFIFMSFIGSISLLPPWAHSKQKSKEN